MLEFNHEMKDAPDEISEAKHPSAVAFGRVSHAELTKARDTKFLPEARRLAAKIGRQHLSEEEETLLARLLFDFAVRCIGENIGHLSDEPEKPSHDLLAERRRHLL